MVAAATRRRPREGMHVRKKIGRRINMAVLENRLTSYFGHPMAISGGVGSRSINWDFGPAKEAVWTFLARDFPEVIVEALHVAIESGSVEINHGDISFPIPPWLKRRDFFESRMDDFPDLIAIGGDPNDTDPYGVSPLEYAIAAQDEPRAIALIKAGAMFVPYGPDGWLGERVETLPALVAFMESLDLSQVTRAVFGSESIRKRL